MKKRWISLLAVLILVLTLCVSALAAGFEAAKADFITDYSGILTELERSELEQRAEEISRQYQCGVYVIVLEDYTGYSYDGSVYEAAKALYQEYELGYGEEKSGELLLVSMADRDYALIAHGYGNTAFTEFGKNKLSEVFVDNFKEDDWYGGFSDYLEKSASMLQSAWDGQPLNADSDPLIGSAGIGISVLLGCGLGLLICWLFKEHQMKSVAVKTEADAYVSAGSAKITNRQDQFTHTTETRKKIEKSSSSSSSSNDGFSGKSGKF